MEQYLPGTVFPSDGGQGGDAAFGRIAPLLEAAGGLTLAQVSSLTGLAPSTVQNWVKRGWVAAPDGKRYGRRCVARIILLNMLRPVMRLDTIVALLKHINGNVEDDADDIIDEGALYSRLCDILARARAQASADPQVLGDIVDGELSRLPAPAREQLHTPLLAMTLACISAALKSESEACQAALGL